MALLSVSPILFQHHIKLRHERHRRQHGESYLPSSFVLDTDEAERGTWGPWSSASSCSRSCGGGVAHQTRQCLDVEWVLIIFNVDLRLFCFIYYYFLTDNSLAIGFERKCKDINDTEYNDDEIYKIFPIYIHDLKLERKYLNRIK